MLRTRLTSRVLLAAAAAVVTAVLAQAQDEGRHPVSGRFYANTMSAAGAPWLDRDEREDEEAPKKAIGLLGLKAGDVVADVGAGSGYFTLKMAELVGPSGRVYASDIQQEMLDIIAVKLRGTALTNVTLVLGDDDDPKLPPGTIDMALMVDVYHELHQPQAVLKRIRAALKQDGRLVLLEYRAEDPKVPIQTLHKMSIATAKQEVEHEGFVLSEVKHDLPWQHLLVFTKK
ncbi:MAG: class I SAM-dependent methyltransferase [Vicinamibacterales bacterium]